MKKFFTYPVFVVLFFSFIGMMGFGAIVKYKFEGGEKYQFLQNIAVTIAGRISDVINVGGLKFMASEVECVALGFPSVSFVKAYPRENPITGQHVELIVQTKDVALFDRDGLKIHLKNELQSHMVPKRIRLEEVEIGHRFKKS